MSRIVWGASGERFFEHGVDRGVLYAPSQDGVAWSGLISISETSYGGEARPYYFDGMKYANIAAAEDFGATIEAYSAPSEFAPCEGIYPVHTGLFVTEQPKVPFDFSYRSIIGNDLDGADHAYKIHLIYGALAAPSARNHQTFSDSTSADPFSWEITTLPPSITGRRAKAHLVVDSRAVSSEILSDVEDILYGTDAVAASIPTPDELIAILGI